MKAKLKELNVDFIGGLGPLTKEELQSISEFIRSKKEKRKLQKSGKAQPSSNQSKQLI